MPLYEYECDDCGEITEELVGISSTKKISCEYCNSPDTHKIISSCNFSVINKVPQKFMDRANSETDKRSKLREEYGVHEVNPLRNPDEPNRPATFDQTYKDIVGNGSLIKEQMDYTVENNEKKQSAKDKQWHKDSAVRLKKYKNEKLQERRNGKKEKSDKKK